jgi:hypothetical protein
LVEIKYINIFWIKVNEIIIEYILNNKKIKILNIKLNTTTIINQDFQVI